ncbi:TRAP transporter substrate-binding protein DctP (plasmid) [Tistrella bauzanensis]|uniref:TRAP transporter substrate-binding protein DctP n=1 Tax=Tistrella arctica TaxID=3133430 RepID=A0ABU9YNF1_9PROT
MKQALFGLVMLGLTAPAAAEDLVITSEVPASHWKSDYVNQFAEMVKDRSGGEIEVKFYPAGQLYSDKDAIAAIGTGSVQMVWPISGNLDALDSRLGLLGLPFTLSDDLMSNPDFSADIARLVSAQVEDRGIAILGLLRATDAIIVMKNTPVTQVSDLAGKRIRSGGGAIAREMVAQMGASPISLPASEMVTSMSQGVIDGVLTSPAGWKTILADTASEGALVPGMFLATYSIVVDATWLKGLSDTNREAVTSAARDVASEQWADAVEKDNADLQAMIDAGKGYHLIDGPQFDAFRAAAQPVIDAYAEAHPGTWKAYLGEAAKHAE